MAKRKAAEEVVAEPVKAPEAPYILVESPDGQGTYPVVLADRVEPRERVVFVGGVTYEHCADAADGRWIYRVSR